MTIEAQKKEDSLQLKKLERGMLTERLHNTIKELYAKGTPKKEIARLLSVDAKTVRRHINKAVWGPYQKGAIGSCLLDPYKEWLLGRMGEVGYNARVLLRELTHLGYGGSYDPVKRFIAPHRQSQVRACVRYETAPGEQSQMDWGSDWVWLGEELVKVHFFALVLGYSRRSFAKGYLHERFLNLVDGHEEAFRWFGGMTRDILYDNPRTMVLQHDVHAREVTLNKQFQDFAEYYGFCPKFCMPYRPQTKGKIESGVKYLKRNFLPGRRFRDLDHLNAELAKWQREVADLRVHGTTHERPVDRFAKETLCPILRPAYQYVPVIQRKVAHDAMISFESNRYSVPWVHAGKCVDLKVAQGRLLISYAGKEIATHVLLAGKNGQVICTAHYAGLMSAKSQKRAHAKMPQHDPAWKEGSHDVVTRSLAVYECVAETLPFSTGATW